MAWVRDGDRVLVPCDEDGLVPELPLWALLDLGLRPLTEEAPGVRAMALAPRLRGRVGDWCARDATTPGSHAVDALDCLACAACCRHNRVLLTREDLARWRKAGREELAGEAYVTGRRRRLRVLAHGDCVLLTGNACGEYALRPDNCRAFPAGSEGCLAAREEPAPSTAPPWV
jgi:hypothetical protein